MTKRILVMPSQAVGEIVISQILYKILKQRHDHVEIDVLASSDFHPVLNRMPEVSKAIDIPKNLRYGSRANRFTMIKDLLRLGFRLRKSYDQVIMYFGTRRFSFMMKSIAQIPVRTGYRISRFDFLNDQRTPPKDEALSPKNWVLQIIHLGQPRNTPFIDYRSVGPFPKLIVDAKNAERCMKRLGLGTVEHRASSYKTPILILVPGAHDAGQPSKRWPYHYFCEIADYYGTRGWKIWLLGSKKEYQIGERIIKSTKTAVHNLCGRTELADVCDLLSKAHLVIGNDSGLMHIAAAVDCFATVIHGPFSPAVMPYFTKKFKHVHYKLPCSDCQRGICRYGHYRCLTEIAPATVIEAANDLIAKNRIT